MKKFFIIALCLLLTSCDTGIDRNEYVYPDEGEETKGDFLKYEESVSFLYPEKFKVYSEVEVKNSHYTFTLENSKSQA